VKGVTPDIDLVTIAEAKFDADIKIHTV
jgi:hypothetical protein